MRWEKEDHLFQKEGEVGAREALDEATQLHGRRMGQSRGLLTTGAPWLPAPPQLSEGGKELRR